MSLSSSRIKTSLRGGTCTLLQSERDADRERRAQIELALHLDRAARSLDDVPADPEPQAESSVVPGGDRTLEAPEELLPVLRTDPDAVVADANDGLTAIAAHDDLDGLARPELDGVGEEVRDHRFEAQSIPESFHVFVDAHRDLAARLRARVGESVGDVPGDLGE